MLLRKTEMSDLSMGKRETSLTNQFNDIYKKTSGESRIA
jgi:hypothetical protein